MTLLEEQLLSLRLDNIVAQMWDDIDNGLLDDVEEDIGHPTDNDPEPIEPEPRGF